NGKRSRLRASRLRAVVQAPVPQRPPRTARSRADAGPDSTKNGTCDDAERLAESAVMRVALAVQLTELCGPGCLLCAGAGRASAPRSMPPEMFERVLLEARALGVRRVVLTGGEPLVHEELNALIDLIERIDVAVEVVATGYRLESREPALRRLGARLVRLTVELLGGTASTHERLSGRSGSFQEARSVLEVAAELGVARRARLIPTKDALRELDGFRAAVARFTPEIVVDRSSSHLPR